MIVLYFPAQETFGENSVTTYLIGSARPVGWMCVLYCARVQAGVRPQPLSVAGWGRGVGVGSG